jgi:hypothetical protein
LKIHTGKCKHFNLIRPSDCCSYKSATVKGEKSLVFHSL